MGRINRRLFLKTSAAGAGIAVLAAGRSVRSAEQKQKFTMDLACGKIGVGANQREAIRLAAQAGFESVAPSAGELAGMSDAERVQCVELLHEQRLVWGAAGLPVNFRQDEATFKRGLDNLKKPARALQAAGVSRVATWLSPSHGELTYLRNFKQHARRLREVAKVLGDYGHRFGLEYVGPKTSWSRAKYPFIHTMAETKELIAEIDQDNVGFLLDSWHWHTAGESKADLLTLTNQDVVACDLNDAPKGLDRDEQMDLQRELPVATGVIDVKTFLEALIEIGYDGPVRAEPFNEELNALGNEAAVAATAAAMRKAFATVQ